ncbi:MAG: YdhR family protein [Rhodospirillaceae bacterium]|nr:YdhR family protein [Rhodospirillaceae bacterium]
MQQMQVTVRYRVAGDHARFRAEMTRSAPIVAGIAGLVRNMWSLDPDSGLGTSIYLFEGEAAARHFLAGPTLEHLLNGPGVSGVAFDLSHADGAHPEIGVPPAAPAPESRAAS